MALAAPPALDLKAELARIDRQRADLLLSGNRVDWTAPIDIPAELARIDAERARQAQARDASGAGTWSDRHAVGIALASGAVGVAVVAGGALAAAEWLPSVGADADPGLLMIGLGLLVLLLVRR